MDQLTRAVLQAVHGLMDSAHLRSWLDHFQPSDRAVPDRRSSLFELVIEAQRLDLVDALLDHPNLRPAGSVKTTDAGIDTGSFNGGLDRARRRAINVEGMGIAFLELLHEHELAFQRQRHPIIAEFSQVSSALRMAQAEVDAARDAMVQKATKGTNDLTRPASSLVPPTSIRKALKKAQGARYVLDTNVVGLAVLHGWTDGVQRLLDAGMDPYAKQAGKAGGHSAMMVAAVFHETASAVALLNHSSFSPSARFGRTRETAAATALWRQIDPNLVRGYDWNLICRSDLLDEPEVRSVMLNRWARMTRNVRQKLTGDDPLAAQRWEQVVLRAEIQAERFDVTQGPRVRDRL